MSLSRTSEAGSMRGGDSDLIETFVQLHNMFGSVRKAYLPSYRSANVQLFHLAQAIGTVYLPTTQMSLDMWRRRAMEQLVELAIKQIGMIEGVMYPDKQARWTWMDYQITPEVACDPGLTGRVVSSSVVTGLARAHKAQVQGVLRKAGF